MQRCTIIKDDSIYMLLHCINAQFTHFLHKCCTVPNGSVPAYRSQWTLCRHTVWFSPASCVGRIICQAASPLGLWRSAVMDLVSVLNLLSHEKSAAGGDTELLMRAAQESINGTVAISQITAAHPRPSFKHALAARALSF